MIGDLETDKYGIFLKTLELYLKENKIKPELETISHRNGGFCEIFNNVSTEPMLFSSFR